MEQGQPTKYKSEYDEQVEKLCKLGSTDKDIANFFNVTDTTINNWKLAHATFFESLKRGKDHFDSELVEKSLRNRAIGCSHPETRVVVVNGVPEKVEITKHYPPDSTAMIFWLKNRQSARWKDKQEIDVNSIDRTGARSFGGEPTDS